MGRRRQFGTVRQLASGRWQARAAGDRRLPASRTFRTKAEAARWLSGLETDRARGLWLDPKAAKVLLAEYAWAWLSGKVQLAPRTKEIYAVQLRLHILPTIAEDVVALGTVTVADLTPALIRSWYAVLSRERGPSVASKAYARLRQILTQAVTDDLIAKNPCRIAGAGAERHDERRFLSLPELYDLAGAVPERYRALILTAGLAGLRQGELFGLRQADVDLRQATITVRRKRLRLASGQVIEDEPKSRAGRRSVALPAPLVTQLEHHLASFTDRLPDGFVFTSTTGSPLERSNFRYRVWVPATELAGLAGLRFHDLRHTAGTLTARTGATTKEIMARLGHASPRAAMVYQHATQDRDRLIAERLTAMTVEAGIETGPPSSDAYGWRRRGRTDGSEAPFT